MNLKPMMSLFASVLLTVLCYSSSAAFVRSATEEYPQGGGGATYSVVSNIVHDIVNDATGKVSRIILGNDEIRADRVFKSATSYHFTEWSPSHSPTNATPALGDIYYGEAVYIGFWQAMQYMWMVDHWEANITQMMLDAGSSITDPDATELKFPDGTLTQRTRVDEYTTTLLATTNDVAAGASAVLTNAVTCGYVATSNMASAVAAEAAATAYAGATNYTFAAATNLAERIDAATNAIHVAETNLAASIVGSTNAVYAVVSNLAATVTTVTNQSQAAWTNIETRIVGVTNVLVGVTNTVAGMTVVLADATNTIYAVTNALANATNAINVVATNLATRIDATTNALHTVTTNLDVRITAATNAVRIVETQLSGRIDAATNTINVVATNLACRIDTATNGLVTAAITNGLASQTWVEGKKYVTATVTNGLASQAWVEAKKYVTKAVTNGLASQAWVEGKDYGTKAWARSHFVTTNGTSKIADDFKLYSADHGSLVFGRDTSGAWSLAGKSSEAAKLYFKTGTGTGAVAAEIGVGTLSGGRDYYGITDAYHATKEPIASIFDATNAADAVVTAATNCLVPWVADTEGNLSAVTIGSRAPDTDVGVMSLAQGLNTVASNLYAHAEGRQTDAGGMAAHAEGFLTAAWGLVSHTEGMRNVAYGQAAHVEGNQNEAYGEASHAEGYHTKAEGKTSHAEGDGTTASGNVSHAEGADTEAFSLASHAEGCETVASNDYAHAEGYQTEAYGEYAHAEGYTTKASGTGSHAEGGFARAYGVYSHAEGYSTVASNYYAHAEGESNKALGWCSHAEGIGTIAQGYVSHAEGRLTQAKGEDSHAEGIYTLTEGKGAHAEGVKGYATNHASFVWQGTENVNYPDTVPVYGSHGKGTFNLNPVGGLSGLYVGETNLATTLAAKRSLDDYSVHGWDFTPFIAACPAFPTSPMPLMTQTTTGGNWYNVLVKQLPLTSDNMIASDSDHAYATEELAKAATSFTAKTTKFVYSAIKDITIYRGTDSLAKVSQLTAATNGMAKAAIVVDATNRVGILENYLGGQNIRVSVTNHLDATSGNLPRLRIEEKTNATWNIIWDENAKFAHFHTNTLGSVAAMTNATITRLNAELAAGLATKAPKAWGDTTSKGGTAPENTVWISHNKTVFSGDSEFKVVEVGTGWMCVLISTGMGAYAQGNPGTFRFTTWDDQYYYGMRVEENYMVGCDTDGITVTPAAGGNLVTLDYNITMTGKPIIYYKPSITNAVWEALNDSTGAPIPGASVVVSWETTPPAGHEYAYISAGNSPCGFFTAAVEETGTKVFETNLPISAHGGYIATNLTTHTTVRIEPYIDESGTVKWRTKP